MTEKIAKKRNSPPPAPKGNKFALGNKGGRPRTISDEPHEMIALGEEMLAWIKAHPDVLHLSQWYSLEKKILYKHWQVMSRAPEFCIYYEQALKLVGIKYLDRDSNVREGASHRWQRLYFADLREEEEATKDAEKERKKEEIRTTQEQLNNTAAVCSQIDKLHESLASNDVAGSTKP